MIIHKKVMCVQHNTNTLRYQAGLAMSPSSPLPPQENKTTIVQIEDTTTASESESETDTESPIQAPLSPASSHPVVPDSSLDHSKKSADHQQQEQQEEQPTKSVRFNPCVTAQPSLHLKNYAPHETAASFYRRQEYESIRSDILKTLSLMRSRNLVDEEDGSESSSQTTATDSQSSIVTNTKPLHKNKNNHNSNKDIYVSSSRGLEKYNAKGSLKSSVRKRRQSVIWAVLEEQDHQVDQAERLKMSYLFYDHDAIRDVYQNLSKVATEVACQRGISDALAASKTKKGPSSSSAHNNNNKHPSNPKSLPRRFFFQKSSSEKNLRKLAAASSSSSEKKLHTKRWSMLSSGRPLVTARMA